MAVRAVLFDLDDTLVAQDSSDDEALRAAAALQSKFQATLCRLISYVFFMPYQSKDVIRIMVPQREL